MLYSLLVSLIYSLGETYIYLIREANHNAVMRKSEHWHSVFHDLLIKREWQSERRYLHEVLTLMLGHKIRQMKPELYSPFWKTSAVDCV